MLWIGYGIVSDHKLSHDYPHGFLASDTFIQPGYSDLIKEVGHFKYFPWYGAFGREDVVGYYPPIPSHATALFSISTGLGVHDSIILLIMILIIIGSLLVYLTIRNFNKHIAILSLPLSVLIFYKNFYVAFTWGQWGVLFGSFCLMAIFWMMTKLDLKKSYILLSIFLIGSFMAHGSETAFAILFIGICFFINIIFKKFKWQDAKTVTLSMIITFIVCFYFIIIFKNTMLYWFGGYSFSVEKTTSRYLFALFSHFGFLKYILIIGLLITFYMILIKKKAHPSLYMGILMLFIGYGNYFGLRHRAFQSRFLWPIYISLFLGIVLYFIVKLVLKKPSIIQTSIISLIILIFLASSFPQTLAPKASMIHPLRWEGLTWFRDNTLKGAKLFFFYGDGYTQTAMFYQSKRDAYSVKVNDFIEALQQGEIRRKYKVMGSGGRLFYRNTFFEYGEYELPYRPDKADVCDFDYFIFDKVGQQQALIQANMYIRQLFLNQGMEEVFSNQFMSVLKNNNPGGDCFEEQRFAE